MHRGMQCIRYRIGTNLNDDCHCVSINKSSWEVSSPCAVWHHFCCRPAVLPLEFSDCLGFFDAWAPFTFPPPPPHLLCASSPNLESTSLQNFISTSVGSWTSTRVSFVFWLIVSVFLLGGCFTCPRTLHRFLELLRDFYEQVFSWHDLACMYVLLILTVCLFIGLLKLLHILFVPNLFLDFVHFDPLVLDQWFPTFFWPCPT
jgi:hypothetical protein